MQLCASSSLQPAGVSHGRATSAWAKNRACRPPQAVAARLTSVCLYDATAGRAVRAARASAGSNGNGKTVAGGQHHHLATDSRGVLILPGLANNTADYTELSQHLNDKGLATRVVQVRRKRAVVERGRVVL